MRVGERRAAEHVDGAAFGKLRALVSLQDVAGEIELPFVAGDAVELDQSKFDLRVPGDDRLLGRGTVVRNQEVVHEADAGIQQSAVAGAAVIGNRGLQHVPETVEFVAGGLGLRRHAIGDAIVLVISVDVAAGLLHGDDLVDHLIGRGAKLRMISGLQREAHRLGPFIRIGIGKHRPNLLGVTLAHQPAEIVHAPVGFEQIVHGRNALGRH